MTHRIAMTLASAAVLAMTIGACSSDDDPTTATVPPVTDSHPLPPETNPPASTAPPVTEPPVTEPPATDAPVPSDLPASTLPTGASSSFAEVAGLGTIELVAPTSGDSQPTLAWSPVDGAASYRLVALTSDGSPYWAWLGTETEVRFGGAPDGGGQTATVFEPMTWTVVALDDAGLPIAVSDPGQLTP